MPGPSKEAHCRRPPRSTSKEDLTARHKGKMMGKFFRNKEEKETPTLTTLANRDSWIRRYKLSTNFEAARRLHMTNQRKALRARKMKDIK